MIYRISDKGFKRILNSKKFILFPIILFPFFWLICFYDLFKWTDENFISISIAVFGTLLMLFFLFALTRKEYRTMTSAIAEFSINGEFIDFVTLNTFRDDERVNHKHNLKDFQISFEKDRNFGILILKSQSKKFFIFEEFYGESFNEIKSLMS